MIPFFGAEDVRAAVSPERALEAVRDAFIAYARGEWTMPPKVYVPAYPAGDFRAMPALGGGHTLLKWVTSFPGNPAQGLPTVTGLVLLSDASNGMLKAVLDAGAVTALRTGAAAVLAAETLGRAEADSAAVIGAGVNGEPFELLKLRTMEVGAEHKGAGYAVNEGDPRITRPGHILRRLSLDEIPQLWNVVRGDMSLVGPRPTLAYQVARYTPRQRRRLEVKPGITGWAQVNGRARLPWDDRIELDVWYVEHRSPWLDLKILARTPRALFAGTYKGESGGWRG